jgi:hypothetical protein
MNIKKIGMTALIAVALTVAMIPTATAHNNTICAVEDYGCYCSSHNDGNPERTKCDSSMGNECNIAVGIEWFMVGVLCEGNYEVPDPLS